MNRSINSSAFRKDINGLRAWAVLSVVLYHFGVKGFGGGFVGVDIFFVISGFLMTRIIVEGLESGSNSFSVWKFYIARAVRIVPALFFLCSVLLIVGWFCLTPIEYSTLGRHVVSAIGFFSNYTFFKEVGYFDVDAHYNIMLHTWSLAVEWQFYIVLPVFLLVVWQIKAERQFAIKCLLAIFAISVVLSVVFTPFKPTAAFYLLPTRAWELLAGGFVFFLGARLKKQDAQHRRYIELGGALLIALSICVFDGKSAWPGWRALIPVLGASLIVLAARENSILTGNFITQWLGRISYSVYLWHWPVVVILIFSNYQQNIFAVVAGLSATLALGYFSYTFIEQSAGKYFKKFSVRDQTLKLVLPALSLVTIAGVVDFNQGFPAHMSSQFNAANQEISMPLINNGWCFYSVDTIKTLPVGDQGFHCKLGDKSAEINVLLFGDSYAGHLEPFWDQIGLQEHLSINSVTTNWCYPSIGAGYPGPSTSRAVDQCQLNRKYFSEHAREYDVIILGGAWHDVASADLKDLDMAIGLASGSSKLVILQPSPVRYDTNIGLAYLRNLLNGVDFKIQQYSSRSDQAVVDANLTVKHMAEKYNNVIFLDRASVYPSSGVSFDSQDRTLPISLDGKHVSVFGSLSSAKTFSSSDQYKDLLAKLALIKSQESSPAKAF
jgi:peptidoglycan/LPS O-acetylase OafA/YrhL